MSVDAIAAPFVLLTATQANHMPKRLHLKKGPVVGLWLSGFIRYRPQPDIQIRLRNCTFEACCRTFLSFSYSHARWGILPGWRGEVFSTEANASPDAESARLPPTVWKRCKESEFRPTPGYPRYNSGTFQFRFASATRKPGNSDNLRPAKYP